MITEKDIQGVLDFTLFGNNNPCIEIREQNGKEYKVFLNGRVDGFLADTVIDNGFLDYVSEIRYMLYQLQEKLK